MTTHAATGRTFGELILELAVRLNLADQTSGAPALPTDAHDLAQCKRYLNAGYEAFVNHDHQWSFLDRDIVIVTGATPTPDNLGETTHRFRLPPWAHGYPIGDLRPDDSVFPYLRVSSSPITQVDRMLAMDASTGAPQVFCVRAIDDPDGAYGAVSELTFYPRPDRAYTLRGRWRATFARLVETEDRLITSGEHDRAILAAAVYEHALDDADGVRSRTDLKLRRDEAFADSRRLDLERRGPTTLGPLRRSTRRRHEAALTEAIPTVTAYGVTILGDTP